MAGQQERHARPDAGGEGGGLMAIRDTKIMAPESLTMQALRKGI
jgi:hypothetical protein